MGWSAESTPILEDHAFALCLTHDVDRMYKTYQSLYYTVTERDPSHLLDVLPWRTPYWQFRKIMDLEAELGVRSAFYFLNERNLFRDKPPRTWVRPSHWKLYAGRYSLADPAIVDVIRDLDEGGWEIGLHGSYDSYRQKERLRYEKEVLEGIVGRRLRGGRQHYLNLDRPETWRYHADIGLRYDASLGSTEEYGFRGRHGVLRPFDDEFVVFPLTLMELALPDVESDPERAWAECERLLSEARDNAAIMTVLWHPRYFNERDHPNFGTLYRRLVERALEMGAWVGPPRELYDSFEHPPGADREADRERTKHRDGRSQLQEG